MNDRRLWIKVGSEAARGPLDERSVRESWVAGVLPDTTLVGESENDLAPITAVLGHRAQYRGPKPGPRLWKGVAIGTGALLVLGAAGAGGYTWWKNRPPPLCKATPNILHGLKANVMLRYYVTRRVKALDAHARTIEQLLAAMKAESGGKLEYAIIDVNDEESSVRAKEAGLIMNAVGGVGPDTAISVDQGFTGIEVLYGAEKDSIKWLPPDTDQEAAEFWIVNKLREVAAKGDGTKRRIGVLTGHHEIAIGDANLVVMAGSKPSIRTIITQYFPYYTLVDVDLRRGESPVDAELEGLVVTQPLDDLTDAELHRIDDFVMQGRALAVVAGAAATSSGDSNMHVTLGDHGLGPLLAGYGFELGKDVVFDPKAAFKMQVATAAGPREARYDFIPVARENEGLDARSAIFFRINELSFPFASTITIHEEKQPRAKFRVLAHTSASALRDRRGSLGLGGERPIAGVGEAGTWVIAASLEGTLHSVFGGASSAKPARVLLIASSAFFANPFARAAGADGPPDRVERIDALGASEVLTQFANAYAQQVITGGILAFKNTLDWLTFDDDLGGCLPMKKDAKPKK